MSLALSRAPLEGNERAGVPAGEKIARFSGSKSCLNGVSCDGQSSFVLVLFTSSETSRPLPSSSFVGYTCKKKSYIYIRVEICLI